MTDKELLEKAAKAAGIDGWYDAKHPEWFDYQETGIWFTNEDDCTSCWNPLEHDGDAFRLAVKLGLRVCVDNKAGFSWVKKFGPSIPHGGDPYAATRRAIVRSAAHLADAQDAG